MSRTGFEVDMRCLPVLFLLLCVMEFKTNIFGILPLRDGILEVRSVTDPETLLCPFFLPGCQSVSDKCGRAREPRRSPERQGGLVSPVAVLGGEHSCGLHVSFSRPDSSVSSPDSVPRSWPSEFLSSNDCVELFQPCS